MSGSRARILLVDDFAPWREYVRSLLAQRQDLLIEAEASDGLEAVEKAKETRPDLILLDIGLPKLNGIKVLKQILTMSPATKIILLTQETPDGFMHEGIRLGAMGYVPKTSAAKDLLKAIDTVLGGSYFGISIVEDEEE